MARNVVSDITRSCKQCGAEFTFSTKGRGLARLHCSPSCAGLSERSARAAKCSDLNCCVSGCDRPVYRAKQKLCAMHDSRLRRTGSVDGRQVRETVGHTGGYLQSWAPGHPLARSSKRVYQHRVVYYAHHGDGPFACFHCGVEVTWDDLNIDHLNDDRADNRIDNLVASCPPCNRIRGQPKAKATARAQSSVQIEFNGETCCVSEWAERVGIAPESMMYRLRNGWTVERAVTEPRGIYGPRSNVARERRATSRREAA